MTNDMNAENQQPNLQAPTLSDAADCSNASILEAIKETDRHMEELYRQAGEGCIVTDGLNAARNRASALTAALISGKHLNAAGERQPAENQKP